VTTPEQPIVQVNASTGVVGETSPYQPCDSCGAPLDEQQRYCVACGTRRRHANDPAARFLAAATRRQRTPSAATAHGVARGRRSASLATAALIAVIPLALGAGVLIGRSSAGGDGKLIAALKAQKAPVIEYSGTARPPAASSVQAVSTASARPVSTFKLSHGYAIELSTLPASTTRTVATKAEQAATAKGAPAVGLIAQSDFTVKPSPPAGAYVIYSGSYSTAQAAQRGLSKLKQKFPGAQVIIIKSVTMASSSSVGGKVLSRTHFGTAHQVTSYKPTAAALSQGSAVAKQDSHSTGKAASGVGLPDVVAVP
jgi:hypothetical protein